MKIEKQISRRKFIGLAGLATAGAVAAACAPAHEHTCCPSSSNHSCGGPSRRSHHRGSYRIDAKNR